MAKADEPMKELGLVIRFDGPPGPEAGRFVEVERDGASIKYGEWVQDGDDWLLVIESEQLALARQVQKACAEKVCVHCGKNRPLFESEPDEHGDTFFYHSYTCKVSSEEFSPFCPASAIHAMKEKELMGGG